MMGDTLHTGPGRALATGATRVLVRGIVQGVGFRPFVYRHARECGLRGWVLNASDGVHIHLEGTPDARRVFLGTFRNAAPRMSHIDSVEATAATAEGYDGFEIRLSDGAEEVSTLVSPDIATCPECTAELFDPDDRRYHYPFINCTQCGPRFTIIDALPYDRPNTSMRDFKMCDPCAGEYHDPADRRFHAQPDACFDCGPRLIWRDASVGSQPIPAGDRTASDALIERAVVLLRDGGILAVKGLGGYHLACDAASERAVATLRERKRRPHKPFAVMVPSLDAARELCDVGPMEEELLAGTVRPIVLMRRRAHSPLASGVVGELGEIGVMLPYTPVQHLLLRAFGGPLVMTSGNLSEEPILSLDDEARDVLGGIADAFLANNRPIMSRYDDSVVRVVDAETVIVRRARGYAPTPIALPSALVDAAGGRAREDVVLATGPEQKNTFCLTRGGQAFVSQHLGDLENMLTYRAWEETVALYERLFDLHPTMLAADMHPEYLSTKWAKAHAGSDPGAGGLPLSLVQHHHAHIAAVTAEHDCPQPVIGVALDGTGYGTDGTIWGGEILLADWRDCTRLAHLECFSMPGGKAAIAHPARIAYSLLLQHGLDGHPGARLVLDAMSDEERGIVRQLVDRGIGCVTTSSAGRLLDAAAALCGICTQTTYDGEPAIAFEAALYDEDGALVADPQAEEARERYRFKLIPGDEPESGNPPLVISPAPALNSALDDIDRGVLPDIVARRFHVAFATAIVQVCERCARETGVSTVALSGGVFMNRFLLTHIRDGLERRGLTVLIGRQLPPNDGCISYGQAVIALARACM